MAPSIYQLALSGLLAFSSVSLSQAGNSPLQKRSHDRYERLNKLHERHERLHHRHHPSAKESAHVDHQILRRDLVVPATLPAGFTDQGCWTDNTGGQKALSGAATASDTMTIELCINYCDGKGYNYAGVEYSHECNCGNKLGSAATKTPNGDCSMACGGNANEPCGGPNRLNVFWNGKPPPADPVHNPGPPGWTYQGCYS